MRAAKECGRALPRAIPHPAAQKTRVEDGAPGCRGWGARQKKKQIPCGNDRKKGKSKSKGKSNGNGKSNSNSNGNGNGKSKGNGNGNDKGNGLPRKRRASVDRGIGPSPGGDA